MLCDRLARSVALLLCLASAGTLAQAPAGAPVEVAQATATDLVRIVQLTGTVTARHAAPLSVSTSGLVVDIAVDAGDRVEQGDLLLQLDAELAAHQYDSARAEQTRAERALKDARRRLEEAQALAPQQSIAETVVRDLAAGVAEAQAAAVADLKRSGVEIDAG